MLLSLVLYGCETWYLASREEYWLGMFGNRVLRKVFGPKRQEITGGGKKLHNEELNQMIKSGRIKWPGPGVV